MAADAVIFIGKGIVLIRRDNPPFQGYYALPGGFVKVGESIEEAVRREAKEETGLDIEILGLIGVYSNPERDPRGHVVSVSYLTEGSGELIHGSDARSAEIFPVSKELPQLAFDHANIIRDALKLRRSILKRSD